MQNSGTHINAAQRNAALLNPVADSATQQARCSSAESARQNVVAAKYRTVLIVANEAPVIYSSKWVSHLLTCVNAAKDLITNKSHHMKT